MKTGRPLMTKRSRRALAGVGLATASLGAMLPSAPSSAGYSISVLSRPWASNGPRSSIRIDGDCGVAVCQTSYKIQYSYYGWRDSGNGKIHLVPNNQTKTTPSGATCNKSPGTYRGRMDMKLVTIGTTGGGFTVKGYGINWTSQQQSTHWIRTSSPHATGLNCSSGGK